MSLARTFLVAVFVLLAQLVGAASVDAAIGYSSLVKDILKPVSYWRLGETSGATTAVDEMGNHDASYVASPTLGVPGLIDGDPDTAVRVDGSTQYVDAGSPAGLEFGGALSVTAWIQPDALPTGEGSFPGIAVVASQWYQSTAHDRFLFALREGGNLGIVVEDNAAPGASSSLGTATMSPGERHFVAFTWVDGSPGTAKLYFDGDLDPFSSVGANRPNTIDTATSAHFRIGGQFSGYPANRAFEGIIDEVTVFDRELSPVEIRQLYTGIVPEPGSLGVWGLVGGVAVVWGMRRRRSARA